MDASLVPYVSGAIVLYKSPLDKKESIAKHILPTHPVLVLDTNFAVAPYSYNCMCITSKLEDYFGYKIFMNTLDPRWRKMSLICTERIYNIQKSDLYEILGFAPASLVEKCKKAFMYTIGMTDEIPEYYRSNDLCMQYLTCGESNEPATPHGQKAIHGDIKDLNTTAYDIPIFPNESGIIYQPSYRVSIDDHKQDLPESCIPTPTENEDPQSIPPEELEEQLPSEGGEVALNDTPDDDFEQAKDSSSGSKKGRLCQDMKEKIEARENGKVSVSKEMVETFNHLESDILYSMWMNRVSSYKLNKDGFAPSYYMAQKLVDYAQYRIQSKKDEMIQGIIDGSMSLKFLGDAFMVAFRCMTQAEAKKIRLGVTTYQTYCKYYGIPFEKTYIGELVANKLIG